MKTGILISIGMWAVAAYLLLIGSGCTARGFGQRFEIYSIDEQQNSSKTYRHEAKPLKCLFVSCDNTSRRYRDNEDMGS